MMQRLCAIVLCSIAFSSVLPAAEKAGGGSGALIEAKRKAANDLFREGKVQESVSLIHEVIKADKSNYRDHLLLARAFDKSNKTEEATESYRKAADLIGASPATPEDRIAKAECERRLKVLDAQVTRIRGVEEEFLKKLDQLEREAIAAKDMRAVERVFRLKAGVWAAGGRKDAGGCEVQANEAWQDSGVAVTKGQRYRVRAAGYWTIRGTKMCTADGIKDVTDNSGRLMAKVETANYYRLGSNVVFVPAESGKLSFITDMVNHTVRVENSGSIYVLIEPE